MNEPPLTRRERAILAFERGLDKPKPTIALTWPPDLHTRMLLAANNLYLPAPFWYEAIQKAKTIFKKIFTTLYKKQLNYTILKKKVK